MSCPECDQWRILTISEAAGYLGFRGKHSAKSLRETIPEHLLPCVPISPGGKIKGYILRDVIAYIQAKRDQVAA